MPHLANARMYSVTPGAPAAWPDRFGWRARTSGVPSRGPDHAFPAPLSELWARPDLACAFMCGMPFMLAREKPVAIAAPVPSDGPMPGRPLYATRLVVAADRPFAVLEHTFGGRLGYTVPDSQSGYNALRHHLLAYRTPERPTLFRDSVGPLTTPRRVIEALLSDAIDVGPLDSYALDLMLRHEPALGERIRVVASTLPAPIPFLVASPHCPAEAVSALRQALLSFGDAVGCAVLRERLKLAGFAPVRIADYDLILDRDAQARAAGYLHPA